IDECLCACALIFRCVGVFYDVRECVPHVHRKGQCAKIALLCPNHMQQSAADAAIGRGRGRLVKLFVAECATCLDNLLVRPVVVLKQLDQKILGHRKSPRMNLCGLYMLSAARAPLTAGSPVRSAVPDAGSVRCAPEAVPPTCLARLHPSPPLA